MSKKLIKLLVFVLVLGTCFIVQIPTTSYGETNEWLTERERLTPEVSITLNGEELSHHVGYGNWDYIIPNEFETVDVEINNVDNAYNIRVDTSPISTGEIFPTDNIYSLDLNQEINTYKITVFNGLETYDYHIALYRKHPDNYYYFNNINLGTMSNLMTFNRNTTTYDISLGASQNDGTMYIYTDLDEYKRNWISVTGQENQELSVYGNATSEYGRVYGVRLIEGQNTVLVRMHVTNSWGGTIFDEIYTINFNVSSTSNNGTPSGGGGGGSTTPTTPPVDTTIDPTTNTVVVSVSETQLASLFKLLENQQNQVKLAVINIPKTEGLNKYGIQLPVTAFTAANDSGIRLETNIGSLTLMDTMLQNAVNTTDVKNVKFNMEYVNKTALPEQAQELLGNHPIISLNMELDGKISEWNNPNSPVIVSIPYIPTTEELANPEKIIVYYIDGQGNLNAVPNATYDATNKCMVFTTTHFSNYAVSYSKKAFTDITDDITKKAAEALAARGVITGKTATEFNPNDTITRAEFITILSRAFEFNTEFSNKFIDVDSSKYYYKPVGMASEMNLINGIGNGLFDPNGTLNKDQIEIIINNLKTSGKLKIDDARMIAVMSSVNKATRGEVAVLVYNLM